MNKDQRKRFMKHYGKIFRSIFTEDEADNAKLNLINFCADNKLMIYPVILPCRGGYHILMSDSPFLTNKTI